MIEQTLEEKRRAESLIERLDREEKDARDQLKIDIDLFIQEKKTMSPLTKWETFYELHEKYHHMFSREVLIERINKRIRKLGQDND